MMVRFGVIADDFTGANDIEVQFKKRGMETMVLTDINNIKNLLVSGKCVSVSHEALGWTKNMPCCMATGQAAGTAAALSKKDKVVPRRLDALKLQKTLKEQGVILE